MTKQDIIAAAIILPEYERKQIALALLASTLNDMAIDEAIEMRVTILDYLTHNTTP